MSKESLFNFNSKIAPSKSSIKTIKKHYFEHENGHNCLIEKFNNKLFIIYEDGDEKDNIVIKGNSNIQRFKHEKDVFAFSKNIIDNTLYFACTTENSSEVHIYALSSLNEDIKEIACFNSKFQGKPSLSIIFKYKDEIVI